MAETDTDPSPAVAINNPIGIRRGRNRRMVA
jgi:hypothetical protein